jgi:hypothetical protein
MQNGNPEAVFNSGGAGYVLNRAALRLLANNALDNPLCQVELSSHSLSVLISAVSFLFIPPPIPFALIFIDFFS